MISIVFVVGAWGVAVPLAYVLTFKLKKDLGLMGIWYVQLASLSRVRALPLHLCLVFLLRRV